MAAWRSAAIGLATRLRVGKHLGSPLRSFAKMPETDLMGALEFAAKLRSTQSEVHIRFIDGGLRG